MATLATFPAAADAVQAKSREAGKAKNRIRPQPMKNAGKGTHVYAPHGSLMIFPRRFFESGGHLRYPIPLFGEEEFVGDMARSIGMPVVWVPSLRSEHFSSYAIGRRSRFTKRCLRRATRRNLLPYRLRIRWKQVNSG